MHSFLRGSQNYHRKFYRVSVKEGPGKERDRKAGNGKRKVSKFQVFSPEVTEDGRAKEGRMWYVVQRAILRLTKELGTLPTTYDVL